MSHATLPKAQLERPLTAEDLRGDLIQLGHPLFGIIWINRERMSGAPCFAGTRVPIKNLFDHLGARGTIPEFLEDFEGVTPSQVQAVLSLAGEELLADLPHA